MAYSPVIVVYVARVFVQRSIGRPAIKDRGPREPQVVRDLSSPIDSIVECDPEAVYEDKRAILLGASHGLSQFGKENSMLLSGDLSDYKVPLRIFTIQAPYSRPLNLRHAVIMRDAHFARPEMELSRGAPSWTKPQGILSRRFSVGGVEDLDYPVVSRPTARVKRGRQALYLLGSYWFAREGGPPIIVIDG